MANPNNKMKYYFQLQVKRFQRSISDMGLSPVVALIFIPVFFIASSVYIFTFNQYSNWIYISVGVLVVFKLGNENRIELLKSLFIKADFYKVRLIENTLVSIPFIAYLIFKGSYLFAVALVLISLLLVVFSFNQKVNFTIPTPFKKIPFEFIVGFRNTLLLMFVAVFLVFKSVEVGNFNLGLFAQGVMILLSLSFYLKPENDFFVWIFAMDSERFLKKKVFHAFIGYIILTIPFVITLSWFFTDEWMFILGLEFLGTLYLVAMVFAKYAAFPNEISLPQAVFLAVCVWFPPMLIIVIPYFYIQSNKKLNFLLG